MRNQEGDSSIASISDKHAGPSQNEIFELTYKFVKNQYGLPSVAEKKF